MSKIMCQVLVPFSENQDNTIVTFPEGEVFEAEEKWARYYASLHPQPFVKILSAPKVETAENVPQAEQAAKRVAAKKK